MKTTLICFDRDLTLIYDNRYHLGRQRNWKSLIKILPKVVSGLKLLRKKLPNAKIYFITNQPGVAIKEFPLLTHEKAHEVCKFVVKTFEKKGFKFDGYGVCEKATPEYVKRKKGKYTFDKKMVGNFSCFKPKPGMANQILKKEGLEKKDIKFYIVGDRASDLQMAKHFNGWGILTPHKQRLQEVDKSKKTKSNKKYIAKDFSDAIKFIIKKEE